MGQHKYIAVAVILNFWNSKFSIVGTVKRVELHHCAKFYQNRSNRGRDIIIFWFFKMAAAAILDFRNFKFLTVGHVKEVELRHRTNFCRNRFIRVQDTVIFPSKFQIFNGRTGRSRGSNCIIVPNFIEIARTAAKICEFQYYASLAWKCIFTPFLVGDGVGSTFPPNDVTLWRSPTEAIYMKICLVGHVLDLITCAKLRFYRGSNFPFSCWFLNGPYNSAA